MTITIADYLLTRLAELGVRHMFGVPGGFNLWFTRVTACQVARPPSVDFVARFQPGQFPIRTARQLSNLTINYSSGSFPHW
jgi:hypothetical protein